MEDEKEEKKIQIFVKLVSYGLDPLLTYKLCGLSLSFPELINKINQQMEGLS